MRLIWITFLLLTNLVFGQHCDTFYTNGSLYESFVQITYRNCTYLDVDTTYFFVIGNEGETSSNGSIKDDGYCLNFFNSKTGKLIQSQIERSDSISSKVYYHSGKLKVLEEAVSQTNPYYFWWSQKRFFENGQVKKEFIRQTGKFSEETKYYPNGTLFSKSIVYDNIPYVFGDYTEYFPNGQISSIRTYSQPDTQDSMFGKYQESELLREVFYDQTGNEIDHDLNEWNEGLTVSIYPLKKLSDDLKLNDTLYTHEQFKDQLPYSNNLTGLKTAIGKHLKLRKKCSCRKGVAWVSMIVSKSGELLLQEIDFPNEEVKEELSNAILKVKTWPAAIHQNKAVDTYISTFIVIDK